MFCYLIIFLFVATLADINPIAPFRTCSTDASTRGPANFVGKGLCTASDGAHSQHNYVRDGLLGCKIECERHSNCIGYTTFPGRPTLVDVDYYDCYYFTDTEAVKSIVTTTASVGPSGWWNGMDCYAFYTAPAPTASPTPHRVRRIFDSKLCCK